MALLKKKVAEKRIAPAAHTKAISITVIRRNQTPEEQHRFRAAIDALLTELVRQQMGREGKEHG
ncbi:MAG TPA: hypothetical protein VIM11_05205 [Tepidisphaeraceae bacterium]|jgi:hypothetical protein